MQDQYSRTQLLLGAEAMTKLHDSRVAVFGVGGVGGYTVEALARSGVGALDLIDDDKVCLTNLNRQIIATRKTVGRFKVDVAEERVHDIDPDIKVTTYKTFFGPETQDSFDFSQFDYVVDAIDTVTGKIALVMKCKEAGVPSSAPWVQATRWTLLASRSRIFIKLPSARWPRSCAPSAASAASST